MLSQQDEGRAAFCWQRQTEQSHGDTEDSPYLKIHLKMCLLISPHRYSFYRVSGRPSVQCRVAVVEGLLRSKE